MHHNLIYPTAWVCSLYFNHHCQPRFTATVYRLYEASLHVWPHIVCYVLDLLLSSAFVFMEEATGESRSKWWRKGWRLLLVSSMWCGLCGGVLLSRQRIATVGQTNGMSNQTVNQSIKKSISQSISQSINQSNSQSVNQSVSQSVNQSVGQSISQSVSQSIN